MNKNVKEFLDFIVCDLVAAGIIIAYNECVRRWKEKKRQNFINDFNIDPAIS